MADDLFNDVSPAAVIADIAAAIPAACRHHIIIIGSLAAGYSFFRDHGGLDVRTKDADCLLAPQDVAVEQAHDVTDALLQHGWIPYFTQGRTFGNRTTSPQDLAVIRLRPRVGHPWFIELLTSTVDNRPKEFLPVDTRNGRLSIAAFPYLGLTAFEPQPAFGIRVARPPMMALANLLNHPGLTAQTMSDPLGQRTLRRCSKDLGRVLALAYLQIKQHGEIDSWLDDWAKAMRDLYPEQAARHARDCGTGLVALMASEEHMDEATHSCTHGLLTRQPVSQGALEAAGQRLVMDVIEPLPERLKI